MALPCPGPPVRAAGEPTQSTEDGASHRQASWGSGGGPGGRRSGHPSPSGEGTARQQAPAAGDSCDVHGVRTPWGGPLGAPGPGRGKPDTGGGAAARWLPSPSWRAGLTWSCRGVWDVSWGPGRACCSRKSVAEACRPSPPAPGSLGLALPTVATQWVRTLGAVQWALPERRPRVLPAGLSPHREGSPSPLHQALLCPAPHKADQQRPRRAQPGGC